MRAAPKDAAALDSSTRKDMEFKRIKGKAREFYSKGCAMGNEWGCEELKKLR